MLTIGERFNRVFPTLLFFCLTAVSVHAESLPDILGEVQSNSELLKTESNNRTALLLESQRDTLSTTLAQIKANTELKEREIDAQTNLNDNASKLADTALISASNLSAAKLESETQRQMNRLDFQLKQEEIAVEAQSQQEKYRLSRLFEQSRLVQDGFSSGAAHNYNSTPMTSTTLLFPTTPVIEPRSAETAAKVSHLSAWPSVTTFQSPIANGSERGLRQYITPPKAAPTPLALLQSALRSGATPHVQSQRISDIAHTGGSPSPIQSRKR